MLLKRPAIAAGLICSLLLVGCVKDDQAAHEPTAKTQKVIPEKGTEADAALAKDLKDQKATDQDEANSKS